MIILTRLSGTPIMINEDFIEIAEEHPDTTITMHNGHTYVVRESLSEIYELLEKRSG